MLKLLPGHQSAIPPEERLAEVCRPCQIFFGLYLQLMQELPQIPDRRSPSEDHSDEVSCTLCPSFSVRIDIR